jgi:predicted permease
MRFDPILFALYRTLLLLYPAEVRDHRGQDMEECFSDLVAAERKKRGTLGVLSVAARTYLDLPASLWRAHRIERTKTKRRGGNTVETLWQDIRFGARGLMKSPGFTVLAVLSLALGIGANTTMFSMANGILWRQLPVPEADRMVRILGIQESDGRVSHANFKDITAQSTDVFSGTLTHYLNSFSVTSDDVSRVAHGELVSEGYFDVLRVEPVHGRFFDVTTEGRSGSPLVVVLSHHLWVDGFGADPGVVGTLVRLSGYPATVVGVAPKSFNGTKFGLAMDLWVPVRTWANLEGWEGFEEERDWSNNLMVARLAPTATLDDANAALEVIGARLREAYPAANRDVSYRAYPEREGAITRAAPILLDLIGLVMLGASGLVLLVACGNVASMLLARAASRRTELGVRTALGAGRQRLVRQMLTETSLLALLGGMAGIALSFWIAPIRMRYMPSLPFRFAIDTAPDGRVLLFAVVAGLAATFAAGLLPALRGSRAGVGSLLRGSGTGSGGGKGGGRLMGTVVTGMVALSFATLFTAWTFTASMAEVRALDPGFETENGLIATVDLALSGGSDEDAPAFFEELLREVGAIPGVERAATAFTLPLGDMHWISPVFDARREYTEEDDVPSAWRTIVSEGYFRTAGTRLVSGRTFRPEDGPDAPGVAVVNQALADLLWPGQNPLGQSIRLADTDQEATEIVGVVATGKYTSMSEGPLPAVFRPLKQMPTTRATLLVRTGVPPATLAGPLRATLSRIDSDVPIFDVKTLDQHYVGSLWIFRMGSEFALALGLLALGLATAGLYGIVSFSVGSRRREMGIRLAMGAPAISLLRTVVLRSLRPAGVGIVIGIGLSIALAGGLRALLVGVETSTLESTLVVTVALLLVSVVATVGPALSALRTDPVRVISAE